MGQGEIIAKLRRKKGWTQAKLAEKTRLSTGYIAAIEEERFIPSKKTLAVIAQALGARIEGILQE